MHRWVWQTLGGYCAAFAVNAQPRNVTVVGEDGTPRAAAVQIVPTVSSLGPGHAGEALQDGKLQIPSLAAGNYEVCLNVRSGGHVNPCLWPSHKLSLVLDGSATPLQFVVKKGAVVTVRLTDTAGLIAANPGSRVMLGIFSPAAGFYPFSTSVTDATGRSYTGTIPYDVTVNFLLHVPGFHIEDSTGHELPGGEYRAPLSVKAGGADLNLTFKVTAVAGKAKP